MTSNCGRDGSGEGRQRRVRFTPILRTNDEEVLTSGTTGNGVEYQGSAQRLKPWIPSRIAGKRAGRALEQEDEERAAQAGITAMGKCDKPKPPDVQSTGGCDKPISRKNGIEGDRDGATRDCDKPGRRSTSGTTEGAPNTDSKGTTTGTGVATRSTARATRIRAQPPAHGTPSSSRSPSGHLTVAERTIGWVWSGRGAGAARAAAAAAGRTGGEGAGTATAAFTFGRRHSGAPLL